MIENYLRSLDNEFGIDFFALKVTDSADMIREINIPDFYKECILCYQELMRIGSIRHENEIVWCNDRFKFDGKVLKFKHWSNCGLKLLGDLYENGSLSKDMIKTCLKKRSGIFFEFWRLKKAVPNSFQTIDANQDLITGGKDFLLNRYMEVPNVGLKPLRELSSKELYNIFNLSSLPDMPSKRYWAKKFDNDNIDWETWFTVNTINPYLPRSAKDYNYKIMFNLVNTETKLFHMKFSNGKCVICKIHNENLEHLLYGCANATPIWNFITKIINGIWPSVLFSKQEAISGFWKNGISNEILILNMITSIVRFHLWKTRNRIKYGNEEISTFQSITILKWELTHHLELLKSNKKCEPMILKLFENIICKLQQNQHQTFNQTTRKRKFERVSS